jgi:hypothetical protein
MKGEEMKRQNTMAESMLLEIEEMERRLETQMLSGGEDGDDLCIWYACTDVCPPGG